MPQWDTHVRSVALASTLAILSTGVSAGEITVFAAVSLSEALEDIVASYEGAGGATVTVSLAATSVLARQIQFGAPADVFLSANADWMDLLDENALLAPETRFDFASNRLVLVGRDPGEVSARPLNAADIETRIGDARIAMALVDAVPAGQYGKAAFQSLGIWDALSDQVVQTDNVRSALALVAAGEAPFGVVYATDGLAEPDVSILGQFGARDHPPIRYTAAAIAGRKTEEVAEFLEYLAGPIASQVFRDRGFSSVDDR